MFSPFQRCNVITYILPHVASTCNGSAHECVFLIYTGLGVDVRSYHDSLFCKQHFQKAGVVQHDGATHDGIEMPEAIRIFQVLTCL